MRTAPKILVVEDESVVAMDLRKILSGLGYIVTDAVGTGDEAIASVRRERPDLVLMDVRLRGDIDGIETAEMIKSRDVPVVYLTAYSEQSTLDRASATEPFGYLLKPFDERELQVAIEMGIYRHRAQRDREALFREQAARAALADEHRWARFLADAGARLSSSLDVERALVTLAELAVEQLADWSSVHVTRDGLVETVAARPDTDLVSQLVGHHPPVASLREGARGVRRVLATGEPVMIPEVRDAVLHEIALDAADLRVMRTLGVRSIVVVPLSVRGEVWGALTILRGGSRPPYSDSDLARVTELADRAALSVENARLYHRVQIANAELSRALQVSEMFVGILGHDLRNPLSSILTGASLIAKRTTSADILKPADRIISSATRMARMIDQILDFTRIRLGTGIPLERRRTSLADVCREAVDELSSATAAEVSVRHVGDPIGNWDSDRLIQLASNLIGNALRHGDGGITIEIDGTAADHVQLEVKNRGGIAAELAASIFEPFSGGGVLAHKRSGSSGLGLGLFISQQIVAAHGGIITCAPLDPDSTRFVVTLPRQPVSGVDR